MESIHDMDKHDDQVREEIAQNEREETINGKVDNAEIDLAQALEDKKADERYERHEERVEKHHEAREAKAERAAERKAEHNRLHKEERGEL